MPKKLVLSDCRRNKVTSFKASLLPEVLPELYEPLEMSRCSESKLFNRTNIKLKS